MTTTKITCPSCDGEVKQSNSSCRVQCPHCLSVLMIFPMTGEIRDLSDSQNITDPETTFSELNNITAHELPRIPVRDGCPEGHAFCNNCQIPTPLIDLERGRVISKSRKVSVSLGMRSDSKGRLSNEYMDVRIPVQVFMDLCLGCRTASGVVWKPEYSKDWASRNRIYVDDSPSVERPSSYEITNPGEPEHKSGTSMDRLLYQREYEERLNDLPSINIFSEELSTTTALRILREHQQRQVAEKHNKHMLRARRP